MTEAEFEVGEEYYAEMDGIYSKQIPQRNDERDNHHDCWIYVHEKTDDQ